MGIFDFFFSPFSGLSRPSLVAVSSHRGEEKVSEREFWSFLVFVVGITAGSIPGGALVGIIGWGSAAYALYALTQHSRGWDDLGYIVEPSNPTGTFYSTDRYLHHRFAGR